MSSWLNNIAGKFIVFDGPDGSGKSTQFARFSRHCSDAGLTVCEVREPGGTDIGEQIRKVLLDPANADMALRCEMMLYMASRAQLIEQRIGPALKKNHLVLADRFISSTLAYQGTAGGMSYDEIMAVGRVAIGERWPDLTVIFDVDEATAVRRTSGLPTRGKAAALEHPGLFEDRMELKGVEFHRRVRQGYLEQAQHGELGQYLVLDASPDEDTVFADLLNALEKQFAGVGSSHRA